MRELVSKLIAGGLSAAVILLWWPSFVDHDGAVSWLVRGVAWTLSFELLLHALRPLELALWEHAAARSVRIPTPRRFGRPNRLASRAAVACCALAVPVVLLAAAPAPPPAEPEAARVKHVTQVKRIVRVERADAPADAQHAPAAVGAQQGVAPQAGPASVPTAHRVNGPRRASGQQARPREPAQGPAPERPTRRPESSDPSGTETDGSGAPAAEPRGAAAQRPGGVA